jgi:Secretion system C-terminal sorting domain
MKTRYCCALRLLFLLFPLLSWGQSISIQGYSPSGNVCVGTPMTVSFTTSGTFATGNTFRVQLSSNYGITYVDLPGSFTSSPASVTLPATADASTNCVFRVVADKPLLFSYSSYSFQVSRPPSATLTGNSAGTEPINRYTPVFLRMALTGGNPYTLTTQDNTVFNKTSEYTSSDDYRVNPTKTTSYSLASVRNTCGVGAVSGSTTVTLNTVPFRIPTRSTTDACLGTQWPVYYSSDGPLPPNTIFEAELVSTNDNNRSVTLPVSGTANPLLVSLPAQLLGSYNYGYRLRIYSRTAGVSAWYADGQSFSLNTPPRFSLQSNLTTDFGTTTSLPFTATTTSSGTLFLNNGQQTTVYGSSWGSGTLGTFMVSATENASYSIVGYSGACADGMTFGNNVAAVQVRPGIRIDSLSAQEVCAGQSFTLHYTAPANYALPERLAVRFSDILSTQVTATVTKPGQLLVTIPASTTPLQSYSIQVRDVATGAVLSQSSAGFTIKTPPILSFSNTVLTAASSGVVSLDGVLSGGGQAVVILHTGQQQEFRGFLREASLSLPVYVSQTTTYSVVSVRNECGVGRTSEGRGQVTVNVSTPSQISSIRIQRIQPSWVSNCPGTPTWISATTSGTFAADNQFQLELSDASGDFGGRFISTTTKAESMSFAWPSQSGSYRLRLSSTNPVSRSGELWISVDSRPTLTARTTVTVPGQSVTGASVTVVAGQPVSVAHSFEGRGPFTYEYENGTSGRGESPFWYTNFPKSTTTYGIKRITDACGLSTTATIGRTQVVVVPSLILTENFSEAQCANLPIRIPFAHVGDNLPVGLTYVVQGSLNQTDWRTLPTTGSRSPLTTQFPTGWGSQTVYYRVVGQTGSGTITGTIRTIRLNTVPNVLLTGPNNQSAVSLDYAYPSLSLSLIDANSSNNTVLVSNGSQLITASAFASGSSVYISSPVGTYSVVAAYNQCGYGTAQGTVRTYLKPIMLRTGGNAACEGKPATLYSYVQGEFESNNTFTYVLTNTTSGIRRQLSGVISSTANPINGRVTQLLSATLAESLAAGLYATEIITSSPATTLTAGDYLEVQRPLSLSLVSRQLVAYIGDRITIPVSSTGGIPYSLTLSTGDVWVAGSSTEYIPLNVTRSGSFSIVKGSNSCGITTTSGVVSITALPTSGVTLRLRDLYTFGSCAGKAIYVDFLTTGTFSPTNSFSLLMSDSNGQNFRSIGTITPGYYSATAIVPATTPTGIGYMFRAASSSPSHEGATIGPLLISATPTGTLTGTTSIFKGDSTRISVALTGTPPWQLTITDLFGPRTFSTSQSPFTLTVRPDTTIGYRLTEVRNSQCGIGSASGTALITVSRLLATEPALPLELRTWPNPTAGTVLLEGELPGVGTLQVRVQTLLGTLVQSQTVQPTAGRIRTQLDLSALPTGTYLLTAEQDGRRSTFKVVKE